MHNTPQLPLQRVISGQQYHKGVRFDLLSSYSYTQHQKNPNGDMLLLLLLLLLMLLAVPPCYVTVMEAQLGAAASSGGHRRTL